MYYHALLFLSFFTDSAVFPHSGQEAPTLAGYLLEVVPLIFTLNTTTQAVTQPDLTIKS